jgi:UDP-N-acetyl-D-glucosamine dehydrogenase
MAKFKVSIIGQGYVGLTLSMAILESGYEVVGFDNNKSVIKSLENLSTTVPGISPKSLSLYIGNGNFFPTTNPSNIDGSDIVIFAVPTPLDFSGKPDVSLLMSAADTVSRHINNSALIINESTSYPGTLRNLIKPIIEKNNENNFSFASAPERVDPGNRKWGIRNTPRVVSGIGATATEKAASFYRNFCEHVHIVSSPEIAETSKLFENTFRQVNIALVNELSEISDKLNLSTQEVIQAASTKPFGFMPFFPSAGVGGHCIPIDPTYLMYASERAGFTPKLIGLANEINESRIKVVVGKIQKLFKGNLSNKSIQIAGISYKPGVKDLRESVALKLISHLKSEGAKVKWFDDFVVTHEGESSSPLDPNVDLGIIVTPHDDLDFSPWKIYGTKVIDISSNLENYGWPKFL